MITGMSLHLKYLELSGKAVVKLENFHLTSQSIPNFFFGKYLTSRQLHCSETFRSKRLQQRILFTGGKVNQVT